MRYQIYPGHTHTSYRISPSVPHSAFLLGGLGAVIGAGNAIAKSNRQVKNQEISKQQAIEQVLNESLGTGLAVAAAAAVVGASRARGMTSLVGILAISAGAKYLWDTAHASEDKAKKTPPAADQKEADSANVSAKSAGAGKTRKKP